MHLVIFVFPYSVPWVLEKPGKSLVECALWLQYVHAHCGKMMVAWGVNHRPIRCSQIYAGNTCSEGQIAIHERWIQRYIKKGERVIIDKVKSFHLNLAARAVSFSAAAPVRLIIFCPSALTLSVDALPSTRF